MNNYHHIRKKKPLSLKSKHFYFHTEGAAARAARIFFTAAMKQPGVRIMKIATTTADFKEYVARDDAAGAIRLLAKCGFRHVDLSMDSAFFDALSIGHRAPKVNPDNISAAILHKHSAFLAQIW